MRNYDPAKFVVSWGPIMMSGAFAPDTFFSVERNEDSFSVEIGASGESTRVMSHNRTGTITVHLMATSTINDLISATALIDELTGEASLPFFAQEIGGTTTVLARNAWVKKLPKTERGTDAPKVEWVFECESVEIFNGGKSGSLF